MSDHHQFLARQCAVNRHMFGPDDRMEGVLDHMAKEAEEVRAAESHQERAEEWVDLVILAQDGLLRAVRENLRENLREEVATLNNSAGRFITDNRGKIIAHVLKDGVVEPSNDCIAEVALEILTAKRDKVEVREYPDWRTAPKDKAIEHNRGEHD